MTAGLPGTGIGGIFYLIGVVCMPIREIPRLVRGKSSLKRWILIAQQWFLSLGIMSGFWMMGSFLGLLIPVNIQSGTTTSANVWKIKPLMISLTVLVVVLVIVEILRLFIPKPGENRY